jgi:hypothetical protein
MISNWQWPMNPCLGNVHANLLMEEHQGEKAWGKQMVWQSLQRTAGRDYRRREKFTADSNAEGMPYGTKTA